MFRHRGILLLVAFPIASWATLCVAANLGWYTAQQADQGHDLFNNHCAECHRPDLTGAMGPALTGSAFKANWGGKTVETLYQFEHRNMPATNPGSLPGDQVMQITAYILQKNGLPAGSTPLSESTARQLTLPQ